MAAKKARNHAGEIDPIHPTSSAAAAASRDTAARPWRPRPLYAGPVVARTRAQNGGARLPVGAASHLGCAALARGRRRGVLEVALQGVGALIDERLQARRGLGRQEVRDPDERAPSGPGDLDLHRRVVVGQAGRVEHHVGHSPTLVVDVEDPLVHGHAVGERAPCGRRPRSGRRSAPARTAYAARRRDGGRPRPARCRMSITVSLRMDAMSSPFLSWCVRRGGPQRPEELAQIARRAASGSSCAAKCPPRGIGVQRLTLKKRSAHSRGGSSRS